MTRNNKTTRRRFMLGGAAIVVGVAYVAANPATVRKAISSLTSSSSGLQTSSTTTRTTSQGGGGGAGTSATNSSTTVASGSATFQAIADTLAYYGMTGRGIVAYGEPLENGNGTFGTLSAAISYYLSQGFTIYPWQDGSNGYTSQLQQIVSAYKAAGGVVLGPTYGYGYETAFFNPVNGSTDIASLLPTEQEFYLTGSSTSPVLSAATAFGANGVCWESPKLLPYWQELYALIYKDCGAGALAGISGWPNSDHGVNYGGAQGASGGHNINTYVRYVNNLPGFAENYYLNDVNQNNIASANGITGAAHNSDGSPCALWSLRGQTDTYAVPQPSTTMAVDCQMYHHGGYSSGGAAPTVSQIASFSVYCATANAELEYNILQSIQGPAFSRTAMPLSIIDNIPYSSAPLEVTTASIYALSSSTPTLLQIPYFNFANSDDNSSNEGETGSYGVASSATVQDFWTSVVPALGSVPFVEADTDPDLIEAQVAATGWTPYATAYSQVSLDSYYATPTTQNFVISNMLGKRGGRKQLWLSNPTEVSRKVRLYLPADQFDYSNEGSAVERLSKVPLSTDHDEFEIDVPAKFWALVDLKARR